MKGVKSNAGVTYQANEDLVVNGQATFTADVDANNSTGGATSTAGLKNAIGTDLSNLDSQNVEDPNQLRAHATIDADGHATTDLNAKADTSTGSATASTVTQTQKGLVVDDNVVPFGPDSSGGSSYEDSYGEDSYGEIVWRLL